MLNDAIEVGTPVLRRLAAHEPRPRGGASSSSTGSSSEPTHEGRAASASRRPSTRAKPLAEYVVPAQTVCNYLNYWFTYLPEALSDRDQVGYALRQILVGSPPGQTQAQSAARRSTCRARSRTPLAGYSGIHANGAHEPRPATFEPYELPILNGQPYGPTGQKGTNADCQGGQIGYALGQLPRPGQPASNPAIVVSDLPGSRGPTTLFCERRRQAGPVRHPHPIAQPSSLGLRTAGR